MASRTTHLDATSGREVVYCHNCSGEWWKDERPNDLECPNCHSGFTEIVSPENDPRPTDDGESLSDIERRHRLHHRHHHFDSDEDLDDDDDDLDDHILRGPGGFFAHQTIFPTPDRRPRDSRNSSRVAPDNTDQIIRRFTELLGDIGGPTMVGRSGPETLFSSQPQRVTLQRFSGPGFTGGVSSFTITTGPSRTRSGSGPGPGVPGMDPDDPFRRLFGNLMGDMGPPQGNQAGGDGNPRPQADFSMALSQLIASLINPHMVHGDAVYSQEALDRIITNLMEANPQSNAPAPASDEAIERLERKKLDEAMLGPELKGECTICIDEMKVGDEAVVLPCKHWFHEQCVVLWLKQHNTCPICRAAIDGEAAGRADSAVPNAQAGPSAIPSHYRRPGTLSSRMRSAQPDPMRDYTPRRDSNSPPMYSGSAQPARIRSPSPSSRRSAQGERARDNRGASSSSNNPLHWFRDRFGGERRS
ncbi:hypothetical protein F5Y04DRAFT_105724 [Hypomontagnella monticulosa]|nr:hypothetical protein F5Y04DRAFT_105724 [Hypomontagnella monticulosa]